MKTLKYTLVITACLIGLSLSASGSLPSPDQPESLQKAIETYENILQKEPWTPLSLGTQKQLQVHDQSPLIKDIKRRLELLGDFRALGNTDNFNPRFETAVKRFQARHGFEETGIIDAAFIKALNVPLETRISQLKANLARIEKEKEPQTGRRIVANIPEYKLHVYEDGRQVLSMDVVVGKTTSQTVVFDDMLNQIVFSPYWNIPDNIVKNEILPAIKRNRNYLRQNNMEITGTRNGLPEIRQKPGPKNALGKVKFLFPNKYNIYFHDTPAKTLFSRQKKAFSHGCIRLSDPFALAKYLLKEDPNWTDAVIQKAMNAGSERYVTLKNPVPVSISYYTAWVDPSGNVHFRDDIYGKDKELVSVQ